MRGEEDDEEEEEEEEKEEEDEELWTGASMLRSGAPPEEVFFTCAFDNMCAGLATARGTKYVLHIPFGRLEVYETASDPEEEINVASSVPLALRQRISARIVHWLMVARLSYADLQYEPIPAPTLKAP